MPASPEPRLRRAGLPVGLALSLLLAGGLLARNAVLPENPPPAHTGGFGEPTCQVCHFGGPTDEGGDAVSFAGVPATYEPGRTYRITVILARPGTRLAGFQLAARFADGPRAGQQAGELRPVDERAAITEHGAPPIAYAHHTRAGTVPTAPDTARWVLEWTAPREAAGTVVFHVAANSADGDNSPLGDAIVAASLESRPASR